MLATMIATHGILVKLFLGVMIVGMFIPKMTANKPLAFKKAAFIYTLVFQAVATMIAFSGIVAYMVGKMSMTPSIIIMIVVWALLMFVEIKKHRLVKKADLSKDGAQALIGNAFIKVTLIEIAMVAMMVILKILEAKGVVSLS